MVYDNDVIPEQDERTSRSAFSQRLRSWLLQLLRTRDSSLKEVLEEVIEEHEGQADEQLEPEEKVMLHNVLSFRDIKVSDIMVPRSDIAAVASNITLPDLKAHIADQRHTRIPVYSKNLDEIKGFIHVKDLLPLLSGDVAFELTPLLRPLLFVPGSMRIIDLLVQMRKAGSHMAIVVDEYGGTDGLVTMENVVEELVGDIQDEHDERDETPENNVVRISDSIIEVSARMPIEMLERQFGLNLITEEKEGDFDTLGGLIFFQLGRVPGKGEVLEQPSGMRFEIIDADPRRIQKVRIITA